MAKAMRNEPARFEGFADQERRFFRQLAKNQRREWFQAHKAEYETGWLRPMQRLLAELRERIDRYFPQHPLGDAKVFRIYRDVRFGTDKSPYKTHVGGYITVAGGGAGPAAAAPIYLHVGATETFACAGHYMMDPSQLARFRAAVLDEQRGAALASLLARLTRAGYEVGAHETLQRVPRGMDPAHPRADLLRRKGLIVSFPELPARLLVRRELVAWLAKHVQRTAPLVGWLADAQD